MATKTIIYKCDNCETGEVKYKVKETKNTTTIDVGSCNKCKKSFGIKSIQSLTIK